MKIIPAIDIIDGKCVRLTQGKYEQKKQYNFSPIEQAKIFEQEGIQYLHLVDLDGAKGDRIVNLKVLTEIASQTSLQIDFGGGIKSKQDVEDALNAGAKQVTAGTIAVQQKSTFLSWLEEYGGEKLILGADALNGKIATNGWLISSDLSLESFLLEYQSKGIRTAICTDISRDGMLNGPATNLYKNLLQRTSMRIIASGGVTTIDDLRNLESIGCYGAIVGKAFLDGKINLKDLQYA